MKTTHPESRQYSVAEELWLIYFNRYLYDTGTITMKEYKAMCEKIAIRCRKKTKQSLG